MDFSIHNNELLVCDVFYSTWTHIDPQSKKPIFTLVFGNNANADDLASKVVATLDILDNTVTWTSHRDDPFALRYLQLVWGKQEIVKEALKTTTECLNGVNGELSWLPKNATWGQCMFFMDAEFDLPLSRLMEVTKPTLSK